MAISDSLLRVGRSRFTAPVVVAAALLALLVNEIGFRSVQHFDSTSREALAERLALIQVRRLLVEAESAQRGYLITARGEYGEAYERAREQLHVRLRTLPAAFRPEGANSAALGRLDKRASERISELDEVTRLFDAGERPRAIQLVLTDIGREKMQAVEQEIEQIERRTLLSFGERQRQLQRALEWSHAGVALLTLFGLLVAHLALQQLRLRDQERSRRQSELQADRDKLEVQVAYRTAELTRVATHLQRVREDERNRLARELHDEFGGLLTAAKLDLARVRSRIHAGAAPLPPEVGERLEHLAGVLDCSIALKRRIVDDLHPQSLRDLGLQAALQGLCEDFAAASGLRIEARVADLPLDDVHALSAYRLVQEALNNTAKHAQATHVQVALQVRQGQARLTVRDDGRGFLVGGERSAGHGLAGMRFRIESCGGTMDVQSAPGAGTAIEAWLPLAGVAAAPAPTPPGCRDTPCRPIPT